MNEQELKALKELMENINKQVSAGLMSKETADEKFKEISAKLAEIEAKQKEIDETLRIRATAMDGLQHDINKGKEKFQISAFIRGAFCGTWDKSNEGERAIVREYMDILARSPMSTSGGSGGYSIPPQAILSFIEKLFARTVLKEAGAMVMTGLTGSPVTIPRQSGSATAYWVAENSAITESAITDAQLSLSPKECAALVKLSNKLIMLAGSNPSIEQLIVNDLTKQIALAIDLAGLRGNAANTPTGIAATANINTIAMGDNGDTPNWEKLLDMQTELEVDNALGGKLAYITHPRIKNYLKKLRVPNYAGQTDGAFVFLPILSDEQLAAQAGYKILSTTQLPVNLTKGGASNCSEIYFGNFEDLIIGQWGGLDLASSNQAGDNNGGAFSSNQTWIRAIQSVDIAVRHPESFCFCNDVKIA